MILIYEVIFETKPLRMSCEAMEDLSRIWIWFGEGSLTYIIGLGSHSPPNLFPIYIPDKLLYREVPYQIIGHLITKYLKDSNKKFWPKFPLTFGTFSLYNYGHDKKELKHIDILNFDTIQLGSMTHME